MPARPSTQRAYKARIEALRQRLASNPTPRLTPSSHHPSSAELLEPAPSSYATACRHYQSWAYALQLSSVNPTPIERKMLKMECNIWTARTHVILDRISEQATALATELGLLEKPPSHEELNALKSKFRTLREALERQKRKTNSLDAKRELLVSQLKALGDRIWDTRESQPLEGSLC